MAKPTRKRRVKKNIESGIAHIHAAFNNTIVMITDVHGNAVAVISWCLVSKVLVNLHHLLLKWLLKLLLNLHKDTGLKTVEVTVKGPGSGREPAIRAL